MRKFLQSTDFLNETWDRNSQSRLLLMLLATGLLICTQGVLKLAHVKESIVSLFPALDSKFKPTCGSGYNCIWYGKRFSCDSLGAFINNRRLCTRNWQSR